MSGASYRFTSSSSSTSTPSSSSNAPQDQSPPKQFLCPISGAIMDDPVVVVNNGYSFDRACIDACKELSYIPPLLRSSPSSSSSPPIDLSSSSLIPNLALKAIILHWCDSVGLPPPPPITQEEARASVERLKNVDERKEGDNLQEGDQPSPSAPTTTWDAKRSEEKIFKGLKNRDVRVQASALDSLFWHAKAEADRSVSLCTPRIMAAISLMLWSTSDSSSLRQLQGNACTVILVLSQTQANKVRIAGGGAVPPLLHVLNHAHSMEAPVDAACAICNLAEDKMSGTIIGHLDAIPSLLEAFYDPTVNHIARRAAATALHYLTTLCPANFTALENTPSIVPQLLNMVNDKSTNAGIVLRPYALRLLSNLVGKAKSGRVELMNKEAVSLMLEILKGDEGMDQHCLIVLYHICTHSPSRFSETAMDHAGAEAVLAADRQMWGEDCRNMAKKMLRLVIAAGKMKTGEQSGTKQEVDEETAPQ